MGGTRSSMGTAGNKRPKKPRIKKNGRLYKTILALLLNVVAIVFVVFVIRQQNPVPKQ